MPLADYFADRFAVAEPAPPALPPVPPGVHVEAAAVPGPAGPVPVRVYRPAGPAGPAGAALLWAHGGGFRHGDLDMPEAEWVSTELVRRAGALVVSVDYRLAGGAVRYPAPIDDVHAVWSWLCTDGGTPQRLLLGGASAGAALALATALRVRDSGGRAPDGLLLAYPFAHFPNPAPDPETARALAAALPPRERFTPEVIEDMVRTYVGRISDLPADALPGAARLAGLPPVRLALSEFDDLRPSGELLARQVREAGGAAQLHVAAGVPHGHLNHPVDLPGIDESLEFLAAALR